jgi:hypothetical protein
MDRKAWAIVFAAAAVCAILLARFYAAGNGFCLGPHVNATDPVLIQRSKAYYATLPPDKQKAYLASPKLPPDVKVALSGIAPPQNASIAQSIDAECWAAEMTVGLEMGATILVALAVGFWTVRQTK